MGHPSLRPHDVIVLLRVRQCVYTRWTYSETANDIGLSASQVHMSIRRAATAGLIAMKRPRQEKDGKLYAGPDMKVAAFIDFLLHGARYAFPPQPLPAAMGWPTASSHPALRQVLRTASDDSASRRVWPSIDGPVFGTGLMPLHSCVLGIAASDAPAIKSLCTQLAMFDELRVGSSRGRRFAAEYLQHKIEHPGESLEVAQ